MARHIIGTRDGGYWSFYPCFYAVNSASQYPCVLPTMNPGIVNYKRAYCARPTSSYFVASPTTYYPIQPPCISDTKVGYWTSTYTPVYPLPSCFPGLKSKPKHREQVEIHPLLTANQGSLDPPALSYDISHSPSHARVRYPGSGRYVPLQVDPRAVCITPVRSCVLAFDNRVLADCVLNVKRLSVEEFLRGVYDHLQGGLSVEELEALESSSVDHDRAYTAMGRRCVAAYDTGREWLRGLKRIDCLGEATWFWGVYVDGGGDEDGRVMLRVSFIRRD